MIIVEIIHACSKEIYQVQFQKWYKRRCRRCGCDANKPYELKSDIIAK